MLADERRRLIQEKKLATKRVERLWSKDQWRDFPVYRVPVDALLLNVDNRRFAAERKLVEEQLGHTLDPENSPNDEMSTVSILLDTGYSADGDVVKGKPSKDYEALKADWLRRQQERPFWIRPDGTVRNGNRRLAMLKRMRTEGGIEGTEWVDAIILESEDIREDDLFDMEQREQLTEDFKVRYTDINLLLALRDAANARGIDWSDAEAIDRVAGELQHVAGKGGDKTYAAIQLRAVKYMDAYLDDSNASGQYQKLLRQVERFRDVGKVMQAMEAYPDKATDMLRVAFAVIRAGLPHGDIRALRRMFVEDRELFGKLLAEIEGEERAWESAPGSQLADPALTTETAEDDEAGAEDPPGPVVPNYPIGRVKGRIKNAIDALNASANADVLSNLQQIANRIAALSQNPDGLDDALEGESGAVVRQALRQIIDWSDGVRAKLSGN